MGDGSPWDTCPLEGHRNDFLFPRGARALEVENAPLLEASLGSWKQGGARSQEGYKGTQSAKRGRSGGSVWRSESGEFMEPAARGERVWVVRWSLQSVEVWVSRRRRELEAQPCLLCRANLRVRVGRAGESSPAAWQGPSSTAATLAAVGTGRRDSPHRGTTRVQVTCTVSWLLFRSTKLHDIKTHGSSLAPLSMRVVFSLFICVKVVAPSPVK